jgi:hypothetical protein
MATARYKYVRRLEATLRRLRRGKDRSGSQEYRNPGKEKAEPA